jgi:tRNA(Ile)-lysidine synthase
MQALQNIQALQDISKSSLPTRMIEEVFPIFEQQIQSNESIAIGVSSGVDSMCLANLLITRYYKKNYPIKHIHIIHCNHKIRPQSEQEEKYIQQFFKGTNIHIFHRNMEGKTDEKSLRNRRYECFNTILQEKNIPILFL